MRKSHSDRAIGGIRPAFTVHDNITSICMGKESKASNPIRRGEKVELWLDPRVQHLAVGCSTCGLFRVMPPALLASRAHLPTTADDTTRTAFRACAPR